MASIDVTHSLCTERLLFLKNTAGSLCLTNNTPTLLELEAPPRVSLIIKLRFVISDKQYIYKFKVGTSKTNYCLFCDGLTPF